MAKKKRGRRVVAMAPNVVPVTTTVTRAAPAPRRKSGGKGIKTAVAAVAGGAVGALVGGLLVRSGMAVTTAAVGVTAAGAVGAFALNGPAKAASVGAAAAGAGQLALGWLAGRAAEQDAEAAKGEEEKKKPEEPKKRQGLNPRATFEELRRRELEEALEEEARAA